MGALVIILLAALWGSILLPGALRSRRNASPLDSVSAFERSMSMLAPPRPGPAGREVLVLDRPSTMTGRPGSARSVARRRANVRRLAALFSVTVIAAAILGGAAWWAAGVSGAAFVGYLAVLRHQAARAAEARAKLRRLDVADAAPGDAHRQPGRVAG